MFEPSLTERRVLAAIHGANVSLCCEAEDLAPLPPQIVADLASVRAQTPLLDAVVVANDERGRPSQQAQALERALAGGRTGALLYVSDILYAEKWDLRGLPLRERKAALRSLLPDLRQVLLVDPVVGRGAEPADAAAAAGLPAVVAKRAAGPYRGGVRDDWRLIAVRAGRGRRKAAGRRARPRPSPIPARFAGRSRAPPRATRSPTATGSPTPCCPTCASVPFTSIDGPTESAASRSTRSSFPSSCPRASTRSTRREPARSPRAASSATTAGGCSPSSTWGASTCTRGFRAADRSTRPTGRCSTSTPRTPRSAM